MSPRFLNPMAPAKLGHGLPLRTLRCALCCRTCSALGELVLSTLALNPLTGRLHVKCGKRQRRDAVCNILY